MRVRRVPVADQPRQRHHLRAARPHLLRQRVRNGDDVYAGVSGEVSGFRRTASFRCPTVGQRASFPCFRFPSCPAHNPVAKQFRIQLDAFSSFGNCILQRSDSWVQNDGVVVNHNKIVLRLFANDKDPPVVSARC